MRRELGDLPARRVAQSNAIVFERGGGADLRDCLVFARSNAARRREFPIVSAAFYGASRFIIEFARERSVVWNHLSLVQIICLETAIVAAILLARESWKTRESRRAERLA